MSEYLDSRDLIKEMEAYDDTLSELKLDLGEAAESGNQLLVEHLRAEIEELVEESEDRVDEIRELADMGIPDWEYGATLIPESLFEEYAQQLAEDIGAVGSDSQWPVYCIDWERAARELQADYTSVTFLGEDYLVRA